LLDVEVDFMRIPEWELGELDEL